MAYDPQREHRRPQPGADDPAPIDALLTTNGASAADPETIRPAPAADDPPPPVSVTPEAADPWSDKLLFGTGISTVIAALIGLLLIRWLWMRRRNGRASTHEA